MEGLGPRQLWEDWLVMVIPTPSCGWSGFACIWEFLKTGGPWTKREMLGL